MFESIQCIVKRLQCIVKSLQCIVESFSFFSHCKCLEIKHASMQNGEKLHLMALSANRHPGTAFLEKMYPQSIQMRLRQTELLNRFP